MLQKEEQQEIKEYDNSSYKNTRPFLNLTMHCIKNVPVKLVTVCLVERASLFIPQYFQHTLRRLLLCI